MADTRPRGNTKYRQVEPDEPFDIPVEEVWTFACCDCALVHRFLEKIVSDDHGNLSIRHLAERDDRATAQLRRRDHGGLQRGESDKWELRRRKEAK